MSKPLIDKVDELLDGDIELEPDDFSYVLLVDDTFGRGNAISAEEVNKVEVIWEKYYGKVEKKPRGWRPDVGWGPVGR